MIVSKDLSDPLCFNTGTLEINCSKEIKIQSINGPLTSLEKFGFGSFDISNLNFLLLVNTGIRVYVGSAKIKLN
ncbi:hypothetical protein VNO77_01293 [Canavalia gladiata]|uniref:Uncharacterized protein n=1 Tax=Canavalia gladiata TaxID=3824 RepID=A0AAN9MVS8_CANGL